MSKKTRKKSDSLLKAAFQDYFVDMLRFLYVDADALFDWNKGYQFLDKELLELYPEQNNKGGTRHVDLLAKVFLLDGTEEWLLFHCEIQNITNHDFPLRMYTYNYRLFDRYQKPVVSFAIFTNEKNQLRPDEYRSSRLGTSIIFQYKTYQIFDHNEEELMSMGNLFALVILTLQNALLTAKKPEEIQNNSRIKILRALVSNDKFDHDAKARFCVFLSKLIYIENPDLNIKFDIEVELFTGGDINMGILEVVTEMAREEAREQV